MPLKSHVIGPVWNHVATRPIPGRHRLRGGAMPAYRLNPKRTVTDASGRQISEVFGVADGHPDLSVAWVMLPSGCQGRTERNDFTEAVIILSGKGRASVDGKTEDVGAGHAIHVPKGALWLLENTSREPLVCYSVCSPAFQPELSRAD